MFDDEAEELWDAALSAAPPALEEAPALEAAPSAGLLPLLSLDLVVGILLIVGVRMAVVLRLDKNAFTPELFLYAIGTAAFLFVSHASSRTNDFSTTRPEHPVLPANRDVGLSPSLSSPGASPGATTSPCARRSTLALSRSVLAARACGPYGS